MANYMYTQPLGDIKKYCLTCRYIQNFKLNKICLGDLRVKCTRCKTGFQSGIYKADAILNFMYLYNRINTKPKKIHTGRVSKIKVSTIKAIMKQYKDGVSIRDIAKRVGLNKNTILKYTKGIDR